VRGSDEGKPRSQTLVNYDITASEPDTGQPQYLHQEGDGGMESGPVQTKMREEMMIKGSDEHN